MFSFNKDNPVDKRLVLIVSDFQVLLDNEEPILYIGKNEVETYIIGVSIDEDFTKRIEWHFHILVTHKLLKDFIKKQVTLNDVMKNGTSIFILEKTFDNSTMQYYPIEYKDIPID